MRTSEPHAYVCGPPRGVRLAVCSCVAWHTLGGGGRGSRGASEQELIDGRRHLTLDMDSDTVARSALDCCFECRARRDCVALAGAVSGAIKSGAGPHFSPHAGQNAGSIAQLVPLVALVARRRRYIRLLVHDQAFCCSSCFSVACTVLSFDAPPEGDHHVGAPWRLEWWPFVLCPPPLGHQHRDLAGAHRRASRSSGFTCWFRP